MAEILGIEPDEVMVRGSRRTEPRAVPVLHRWKIVCREPGLRVDEQIAHVLQRLTPHTAAITTPARRLNTEGGGLSAVLEVVRRFDDELDQQDPVTGEDGEGDAPNLFGRHLDRAVLDVDDYDLASSPAEC